MSCRHFSWLFILCVLAAIPARAQAPDIATPEQIAIAFYKTAGLRPNFSSWAKDSEEYSLTPVARRPRTEARLAGQLQESFLRFSPQNDLLNVATSAVVTLSEEPDPDDITQARYFLRWDLDSQNIDFFPYEYRDTVFALMPAGLPAFQSAPITPAQYTYIKERMGNARRQRIVLHMRAASADSTGPVRIFGEDAWVLTTDMAGVTLWDGQGALLWERSAGWYVSPQTQQLNELKQERAAGE